MKKHILLISLAILLIAGKETNAQGICDPSGNILIYSNYDGGTFTSILMRTFQTFELDYALMSN